MPCRSRFGFTLVEIMIVVLIIGILLAIAIPNFVAARETSRAKSCIANLYEVNNAKAQCTMDNRLSLTSTATFSVDGSTATTPGPNGTYQLVCNGANGYNYIRQVPVCASGGQYSAGAVTAAPSCNFTGTVGSGYAPGEKWWHGY